MAKFDGGSLLCCANGLHGQGERKVAELCDGVELPALSAMVELVRGMADDPHFAVKDAGHYLMRDPALAIRVLRAATKNDPCGSRSTTVNLNHATLLLGVNRVCGLADGAAVVESGYPPRTKTNLTRLYGRAAYTALMAQDWAWRRRDHDPGEVALAALLNGLGGFVLWVAAPDIMDCLTELKELRGAMADEAEYVTAGFSIERLGYELAQRWGLPRLATEAMEPARVQDPRTYGVTLAVQICRAAAYGWSGREAADNVMLAANYLGLDLDGLAGVVNAVTEDYNDFVGFYGLPPMPPLDPETFRERDREEDGVAEGDEAFCLAPRAEVVAEGMRRLAAADELSATPEALMQEVGRIVHHGLGLNRVVFAMPSVDGTALAARVVVGASYEPAFNRFRIPLREGHLFTRIIREPQAFWLNDDNREEAWPLISRAVRELIGVTGFYAMPIILDGELWALVYADRRSDKIGLDRRSFDSFRAVVEAAARAAARLAPGWQGSSE